MEAYFDFRNRSYMEHTCRASSEVRLRPGSRVESGQIHIEIRLHPECKPVRVSKNLKILIGSSIQDTKRIHLLCLATPSIWSGIYGGPSQNPI